MKKTILIEAISCLFILLFIYAATSKLLNFQKFSVQLGQSPLLTLFVGWIAWIIPAMEIVIALLLLLPRFRLLGMYASFTLMTMFTTYIIVILDFAVYIPCSCGGILQNMDWNTHLLFNVFFTLLAAVGILLQSKYRFATDETHRNIFRHSRTPV